MVSKYFGPHDPLAPKPPQISQISRHALFGPNFVRQHMLIDEAWKNEDIKDGFEMITKLLKKHLKYHELEKIHRAADLCARNQRLRTQVKDGRTLLQQALEGEEQNKLRLILINHKHMQRLYAQMPLHDVVDNINQKTFNLRKEYDRWHCKLLKLSEDMEQKLMVKADLMDRSIYFEEFHLQEESMQHELAKEIQNSKTRLQSLQTINITYKKILQVLRHDEKFQEPILNSLADDIKSQQAFIDQIIHVGTPAIKRFAELKQEAWALDDNHRKQRQSKGVMFSEMQRMRSQVIRASVVRVFRPLVNFKKRYVRETKSMEILKIQLQELEEKIKKVQEATLCSMPETIRPTFKMQAAWNIQYAKKCSMQVLRSDNLQYRVHTAAQKKQSILDEFVGIVQKRQQEIDRLKQLIAAEDKIKEETIIKLKEHSHIALLLRIHLWNLSDILRHVHLKHDQYVRQPDYIKSYMKLPLLKFEQLEMKAVPPKNFEKNTSKVMETIIEKVQLITNTYIYLLMANKDHDSVSIEDNKQKYNQEFLEVKYMLDEHAEANADDLVKFRRPPESPRADPSVPSRSFIKLKSSQIMEQHQREDD